MELLRTVLFAQVNDGQAAHSMKDIIDLDLELLKHLDPLSQDYILKCDDISSDYLSWHRKTRKSCDLARAVYFSRLVVALGLSSHQACPSLGQAALASAASIVFAEAAKYRGSRQYFDEAISLARTAATSGEPEWPKQFIFLQNLASLLETRFFSSRDPDDLKEVIETYDKIANAIPTDSALPPDDWVLQRAGAIFQYWELYRDPRDLEKALQIFRQAVGSPGLEDSEARNRYLQYAHRLFSVYMFLPEVQYLDEIARLLDEASRIPPEGEDSKVQYLIAKGVLLDIRTERSNDITSSKQAVECFEEGLRIVSPGSKNKNILLNNLINSTLRICEYDSEGVNETQGYLQIVDAHLARAGFPNDSGVLLNSARFKHFWYQQSSDKQALQEANLLVRKALEIRNLDSATMAILSAPILIDYWGLSKLPEDFDIVFSQLMIAWKAPNESPHTRIQAARHAADALYKCNRFDEAWHILQQAVELIVMACPRRLERKDQTFIISTLSGLSNDACAMGIAAGIDITEVLQTLERGRGIAVALAHRASEELGDLEPNVRELYDRFEDCKSRVYFSSLTQDLSIFDITDPGRLKASTVQRELQEDFQSLLDKVKGEPQLLRLISPPRKDFFQSLASNGPIIVVNSSNFRDDVIIVSENRVWTFQPDHDSVEMRQRYRRPFTVKDVARRIVRLISRGGEGIWRNISSRNLTLHGMLTWLWDYVVKRVCEELGITFNLRTFNLPRIWWLPTGYFSQLPFHAAGDYVGDSAYNLLIHRAVPSYISSFRMLRWARSKSKNLEEVKYRGMIVTMAAQKQLRPPRGTIFIRTAKDEADAVENEAKRISWIREDRPSAAKVLEELPNCSFVHFGCHGESDPREPSQSHLKLFARRSENDDDPSNVDCLTAASISTVVTHVSVLAVLSACFTTEIRELTHLDEGLQIGNAFQIAGFPHVVGSLWAASDVVCPKWSRKFYLYLNSYMVLYALSDDHIARAYHLALFAMFHEYPDFAFLWAPFVHIGP